MAFNIIVETTVDSSERAFQILEEVGAERLDQTEGYEPYINDFNNIVVIVSVPDETIANKILELSDVVEVYDILEKDLE